MATPAFLLLVLAALALLGRPPARPTARELLRAAVRGAVTLSRLSDRRRERLLPPPRTAGHGPVARGPRSASLAGRAIPP